MTTKASMDRSVGQLLTISEVAGRLSVSESSVKRFLSDGSLRSVKLGKARKSPRRVRESDLASFVSARTG